MKSLKLKIENYEFEVPVFEKDGRSWVALRPLCHILGIDEYTQQKRARSNESISHQDMLATGSDGKRYEMLCIEIDSVGEWIFSINPNKVRPEIKERMTLFRKKLQHVLYAAVTGHIDINMVATLVEEVRQMRRIITSQGEMIQSLNQTIEYLVQKDTLNEHYVDKQLASVGGKLLSNVSAKRRKAPVLA